MSKISFEYQVCKICHQHSVLLGDCKNPHCGDAKLQHKWDYERGKATLAALEKIFDKKGVKND